MNINELKENINHQTRNGRTTVYLPVSTIKQLDSNYESNNEFEYVDVTYLHRLVRDYERTHFKESLKVDTLKDTKVSKVQGKNYILEPIDIDR